MKILSVQQIRDWDKYTIEQKKISSVGLMEDAASACVNWLMKRYAEKSFVIFCGKGNNGGDGLAIARLLAHAGSEVKIYVADPGKPGSGDFEANYERVVQAGIEPISIRVTEEIPPLDKRAIIIDALFGSGLNRAVEGLEKDIIEHINTSGSEIIAIDIPSGLFADKSSKGVAVIKAAHTLTFQVIKLAFLMAENEEFFGEIHVLDIGLEQAFLETVNTGKNLIEERLITKIFRPRKSFSHKGTFGHALLLAGSRGKMGAAVLCAKACTHTGSGLVSCYLPESGNDIMQIAIPEVMCISSGAKDALKDLPEDISKYQAVGAGPGIGKAPETAELIGKLLETIGKPIVIDADALNIISENQAMLSSIPPNSILTPHPKEFERLFGKTGNEFERVELAIAKALEHNIVIVLKGHHTLVGLPDGNAFFNNTGNSGMAKGGAGDALTGIITSLLGQGYEPGNAALLGVYLHGLAGDIAAERFGEESMLASDLINCIGEAYKKIKSTDC